MRKEQDFMFGKFCCAVEFLLPALIFFSNLFERQRIR